MAKHTSPLWILCLTETCERYGFYAIQSLMALYLSIYWGLSDIQVYLLVASFTALTYISPFVGGFIADHFLGQRKAVLIGAVILCLSYFGFAFSHFGHSIIMTLVAIAVGTGLLKPNISSLLGNQYAIDDPKRNSGFTIFYMGINFGILLGTTLPSRIQWLWGWPLCFMSASVGLLISFLIFYVGIKKLPIPESAELHRRNRPWINMVLSIFAIVLFSIICYGVLLYSLLSTLFFILVVIACIAYVLTTAYQESGEQRKKTIAFLLLCGVSVLFWALYFQMFTALTLFISRSVEPSVAGLLFPPPYYIAVQSLGILVFGFILQKYWATRPIHRIAYSVAVKFSIAIVLMLIAYGLIMLAIGNPHSIQKISPWLIILAYLVIALAELMLSPIGLAAVTTLVRPQIVSTMMGIFFVSLGVGGYLSGKLADIAAIDASVHNIISIKMHYFSAFSKLMLILVGACLISFLVVFIIRGLFQNKPAQREVSL